MGDAVDMQRSARDSLGETAEGFLMSTANENYAADRAQEERERDALERYYRRRLAEIQGGAPLSEHFLSIEVLQELADGRASRHGTRRSG
jgi:hypothetical protein